jgi:carbohydrate-selective porin OprB
VHALRWICNEFEHWDHNWGADSAAAALRDQRDALAQDIGISAVLCGGALVLEHRLAAQHKHDALLSTLKQLHDWLTQYTLRGAAPVELDIAYMSNTVANDLAKYKKAAGPGTT